MAEKVIFSGTTKEIWIKTGVTDIDVQIDMYSAWKDWVFEEPNWDAAFRTFGGDPTTTSQFAPRYFFLINGWRVIAKDVSVSIQTNLYSEDYDSPFIVDNAAVTNRTSDVPVVKSELEQRLDYGDRVYYDETSPYTGTDYPVGTIAQPVNNAFDAIAIAELYNIRDFYCLSDINLPGISGQTFSDYSLIGDRENLTLTSHNNNTFVNTDWTNFTIDANFGGGSGNQLSRCIINNALNLSGSITNSQIGGAGFSGLVRTESDIVIANCYSGVAGAGTPTFDMGQDYSTTLSIRAYSGGVNVINANTSGDTATVELIAGQIKLNSSCTDGYIDLRGVGYITDNSSGTTIKTTGFIDSFEEYVESTKELDERLAYQNTLYYDPVNGFTGTTYPIGTSAKPSNNIPELYYLSEYGTNIKNIRVRENFTVSGITSILPPGAKMDYFTITADAPGVEMYVYDNGIAENVKVENFNLMEIHQDGLYNEFFMCNLHEVYGAAGSYANCSIYGEDIHEDGSFHNHKFRVQENTTLVSCYPGEAGSPPTIWMTNTGGTELSIRDWNGDIIIDKIEHINDRIVIEVVAGKVILTSGCTGGIIDLRGVGYIENNAGTGCTIITTGFVDSFQTYIEETLEIDQQLAYANKLYIDQLSGFTGTTYPIGTQAKPVDNIINLFQMSQELNIKNIHVVSELTLFNQPFIGSDYNAYSDTPNIPVYVDSISGSRTFNVGLYGFDLIDCDFVGNDHFFDKCVLRNVKGLSGHLVACDLDRGLDPNDPFYLSGGTHIEIYGNTTFVNSHPRHAGDPPSIRLVNPSGTTCAFRSWNGDLDLDLVSHVNDRVIVEMDAGAVTIGSGCTDGLIEIRGVGQVIDNSISPCVVRRDGQLQASPGEYNGKIVLDVINGKSGTLYPIGTNSEPVDNIDDALILLDNYQLDVIHIEGALSIDNKNLSYITFSADRSVGNYLSITNSVTDHIYIENLTVLNLVQSGTCRYTTSVLVNIDNFDGGAKDCLLVGDFDIAGTGSNYFTNCDRYVTDPSVFSTIDVGDKNLNIIRGRGNYKIINKTSTNTTTIDLVAGVVEIDSSCVSGSIFIGGISEIIDNSGSGCTVNIKALSNSSIADSTWDEQLSEHLQIGSTGDALYNVSAGASPEIIAQAVWNAQLSGFTTPGSAGYSLSFILDATSGTSSGVTEQLEIISTDVKRILGLTQENFLIKDHVYDTNDLLQSATIRTFNSASDTTNDVSPLAEYAMTALYDGSGRLTNYKVIQV